MHDPTSFSGRIWLNIFLHRIINNVDDTWKPKGQRNMRGTPLFGKATKMHGTPSRVSASVQRLVSINSYSSSPREAMTAPVPSGTIASETIILDGATRRVTIGVLALQVEERLEASSAVYSSSSSNKKR